MLPVLLPLATWIAVTTAIPTTGPEERPCPQDVVVARDSTTLHRLLEAGPRDIWVAGVLKGNFRSSRSVALHGCESAVLDGNGLGSILVMQGDDIVIEDLRFRASGINTSGEDSAIKLAGERNIVRRVDVQDTLYGIAFEACHACLLEHSHVRGRDIDPNMRGDGVKLWEAHGSNVRDNLIEDVRDTVVWYSRHVTLERNTILRGRYGTHFMYAHDSRVAHSTMRDNVVGIFFMYDMRVSAEDNIVAGSRGPAGMGIGFKESDAVTLKRNLIVANTTGVFLDYTPRNPEQEVLFEGNLFALDGIALRMHGGERGVRFVANDFQANDTLIQVDGNSDALGIDFTGNHWDDYNGYDLDHDGVGDVAFLVQQSATDLSDARPQLRFFQSTPALLVYEAIGNAMPFLGKRLLLRDDKPAMQPHPRAAEVQP